MTNGEVTTPASSLDRPKKYIFIDANVLIPMFSGSDTNGLELLVALSRLGSAPLLTTDITRIETAKILAERDCDIIKPVDNNSFRDRIQDLMDVSLPAPDMRALYLKSYSQHMDTVESATSDDPWENIDISDIDLRGIFSQYGEKRNLFSNETKKHQFADAIVFEKLKCIATPETPVYIYSRDKDFVSVTQETPDMEQAGTWDDLLRLLDVDEDIGEVRGLIEANHTTIVGAVSESIDSRFFNPLRHSVINASNYVSSVESKLYSSIRYKHHIVVSGTVFVTYHFPYPLPLPFGSAWDVNMTLRAEGNVEPAGYTFKVGLLANLYDYRRLGIDWYEKEQIMDGDMALEIEGAGHFIGYEIMKLVWPIQRD